MLYIVRKSLINDFVSRNLAAPIFRVSSNTRRTSSLSAHAIKKEMCLVFVVVVNQLVFFFFI